MHSPQPLARNLARRAALAAGVLCLCTLTARPGLARPVPAPPQPLGRVAAGGAVSLALADVRRVACYNARMIARETQSKADPRAGARGS